MTTTEKQRKEPEFAGLIAKTGFIEVHYTHLQGTVKRYCVLRVPTAEFLHPQVTAELDRGERERLKNRWDFLAEPALW